MICALAAASLVIPQAVDAPPPTAPAAPAPADVLGALSAASPDGTVHVVVTALRDGEGEPVAAHALVQRPGALVAWVALPRPTLPDAVVAESAQAIHLAYRRADLGLDLVTIDAAGAEVGRADTGSLVPVGAQVDVGAAIAAAESDHGPCIGLPLACGSLLLVDFDGGETAGALYSTCRVVRCERLACGAEEWLQRARDLSRAGDHAGELRALEAAIDAAPDDPRVYRAMSRYHERRGDDDRRIACLALALHRLHPRGEQSQRPAAWRVGAPEALLALEYVQARHDRGGAREAHAALDVAESLYPSMEQVVLKRAELLLEEGLVEDAVRVLDLALAQVDAGAGLAGAYADVGRFLVESSQDAHAIRFLEDAYVLGDRSEFLIRELAEATARLGEHDRAAEWLERLADAWSKTLAREDDPQRRVRGEERLAALRAEIAAQRALAR